MKKRHILVVSQYFFPEQFRINDICEEWVNRGYKVTVLTGIPNYPKGKFYRDYSFFKRRKETYRGIDIIRLPIIPRGKNSIMLSLNYLSFVISGFIWQLFTKITPDTVFIYEVSPMTQALPGIWLSKKRKIPTNLYITDLWPENVEIVTGISNRFILNTIGKMVDYIYENSTKIFTASQSFVEEIAQRGVKKNKILFWPQYAEDFYQPLTEYVDNQIQRDGTLNIIFAGNIGVAQGLHILPEAAKILIDQKVDFKFNLVGDGRYKKELINIVNENHLEDYFQFIEKKPATEIPALMKNADLALISLSKSKVFAKTIPAKTQSCLACGIPILVSADGEIQDIIKAAECGYYGDALDYVKLAENIIRFSKLENDEIKKMKSNAISFGEKKYNKIKLLNEMDKYIGG